MPWIVYTLITLWSALLGAGLGVLTGALCVDWYRISSFEGQSGFFVVGIGLAGGVIGLVVGLVCVLLVAGSGGGYGRAALIASAAVLGLAAAIVLLCRLLADVPPQLDGRPLTLEVELRLPLDQALPAEDVVRLELHSVSGRRSRAQQQGSFDLGAAYTVGERWVIPGAVFLYTGRGDRALVYTLNRQAMESFRVPLPARPGPAYLEWSDWLPKPPAGMPPWPDDKISYRFRVTKVPPREPPPSWEQVQADRAELAWQKFRELPESASVRDLLPHAALHMAEDLRATALARIADHPQLVEQLALMIADDDARAAAEALRLFARLPQVPEQLAEPVTQFGRDLVQRMRSGVANSAEQDPSYEWAAEVSIRFSAWIDAARVLRSQKIGDFSTELGQILELSRQREDSYVMQVDVRRVASYHYHQWTGTAPAPDDPPPRRE